MNTKHIETLHEKKDVIESKEVDILELSNELEARGEEKLTAKDWLGLLGGLLSDSRLVSRHAELIESENEGVALRAIELGYKIKGRLSEPSTEAITIKLDFIKD